MYQRIATPRNALEKLLLGVGVALFNIIIEFLVEKMDDEESVLVV